MLTSLFIHTGGKNKRWVGLNKLEYNFYRSCSKDTVNSVSFRRDSAIEVFVVDVQCSSICCAVKSWNLLCV